VQLEPWTAWLLQRDDLPIGLLANDMDEPV
jgi:hypothetical protein